MAVNVEVRTDVILRDRETNEVLDEFSVTREKVYYDPEDTQELIQRIANSAKAQFDDVDPEDEE